MEDEKCVLGIIRLKEERACAMIWVRSGLAG